MTPPPKVHPRSGPTAPPGSIRAFISYSREDQATVNKIAEVLTSQGVDLLYDANLGVGEEFIDQIIKRIAHAHVFLPVLTERSGTRSWVQQEIGCAVALRVPIVPVGIRCDPGDLLHGIEAIRLENEEMETIQARLSRSSLEHCLRQAMRTPALFECADTTEDRAELIAEYANAVSDMGRFGEVHQLGGLSSFHIPMETTREAVWTKRYGIMHSTEHHKRVLREERMALTEHARHAGCKIVIDVDLTYSSYGEEARLTRLASMRDFLRKEMDDARCQVALAKDLGENLLIVGDWFAAKSISPRAGEGYRQTIFTRHGPTVKKMLEEFERDFAQALGGLKPRESRRCALREIDNRIKELQEKQSESR